MIGEGNVVMLSNMPWGVNTTRREKNEMYHGWVLYTYKSNVLFEGSLHKGQLLSGFKTNDWIKFIQYIFSIALDGCKIVDIYMVVYKISCLVRWIAKKNINIGSIYENKINTIKVACMPEKHFPTSILTVQVHLMVHVVDKVAIEGVVQSRKYFLLRDFMNTLKNLCNNKLGKRVVWPRDSWCKSLLYTYLDSLGKEKNLCQFLND